MKRIRRYAAILAGLLGTLAVFGATPAFAMILPGTGGGEVGPARPPAVVRTVVVGGTPGWQIALIAIGAALVAAAAAVLADRARTRRRPTVSPA
jgi:MFS family permease